MTTANGMVQNLMPSIKEPGSWDVLVGHYLGVDHVGHTYDVHSSHMAAKLQQMNEHVEKVRCDVICVHVCFVCNHMLSERKHRAQRPANMPSSCRTPALTSVIDDDMCSSVLVTDSVVGPSSL